MTKAFITDLTEGTTIASFYLAKNIQTASKKSGESYLKLVLSDKTGQTAAVYWDPVTDETREIKEGDVVKVQVQVGNYQGTRQLTVQRLLKAMPDEVTIEDYLPRSTQDPEAMLAKLDGLVGGLTNPDLKALLAKMFGTPALRSAYAAAPGAMHLHHAVLGGLLEHSLSTAETCEFLAGHYPAIDRDLLLAAALVHDIGKIKELAWDRLFAHTDPGNLLGHITLGTMAIEKFIASLPEFPAELTMNLLHCVLSHHGKKEWGSPVEPATLEALVLHRAEDLDSKVAAFLTHAETAPDPQHEGWTLWNKQFGRSLRLPLAKAA